MAKLDINFGGIYSRWYETKVPDGKCWDCSNVSIDQGILEVGKRYTFASSRTGSTVDDTGYGLGYGNWTGNELQKLSINGFPSSGYISISVSGVHAAALSLDSTTSDIVQALENLSNVGVGDFNIYGGPLPEKDLYFEFKGSFANAPQNLLTVASTGFTASFTRIREGGSHEWFLSITKDAGKSTATLRALKNPTSNTLGSSWTSITTGLSASDWTFNQYEDKVYMVNPNDGLKFIRLGGTWNDGTVYTAPLAPTTEPSATYQTGEWNYLNFSGATIVATGFGTDPTITNNGTSIKVKLNASIDEKKSPNLTITIPASTCPDFRYYDLYCVHTDGTRVTVQPDYTSLQFVTSGLELISKTAKAKTDVNADVNFDVFQFSKVREDLEGIRTIKLGFSLYDTENKDFNVKVGYAAKLGVSPCSRIAESSPVDLDVESTKPKKINYGYTFYNTTTKLESVMSPTSNPIKGGTYAGWDNVFGGWTEISLVGNNTMTASDRIYLYRERTLDGTYVRIPYTLDQESANNPVSGTVTFRDFYEESELVDFTEYTNSSNFELPDGLSNITGWKGSQVLVGDRKIWMSEVGGPQKFAESPDTGVTLNADDEYGPRTLYMSYNRSENPLVCVSQDSLYFAGPNNAYVMVGDYPLGASSPSKLPDSRGVLGVRGAIPYQQGMLMASQDGLWYYQVDKSFVSGNNSAALSKEVSNEYRNTWKSFVGSNMVIGERQGYVWIFNGSSYIMFGNDTQTTKGIFQTSPSCFVNVPERGLYFQDTKGNVYLMGNYTEDNGQIVKWTYETGLITTSQRARILSIELDCKGKPSVKVTSYDGANGSTEQILKQSINKNYRYGFTSPTGLWGWQHKIEISGTSNDKVYSLTINFDSTGDAKPN